MIKDLTFTDLYAEVQNFYAEQVRLQDHNAFEPFAATFTEDAVFQHRPGEPGVHGRADIAAVARRFAAKLEAEEIQRRHWFNMLAVRPGEDGAIDASYYALVVDTKPNSRPLIGPSCVVHDVLVRTEDGDLLTRSRRIDHDEIREAV
jgi:actinorhodin biosynthesis protein ActVIA